MAKAMTATDSGTQPQRVPLKFTMVDITNEPTPRSEEAGKAEVKKTGHARVNKWATGRYIEQVIRPTGMRSAETLYKFGVHPDGFVAVYCVPPGTPKAAAFKLNKNGEMIVHMREVFEQEPGIRPAVDRKCVAYIDRDADGVMCLVINVAAGQEVVKGGGRPKASTKTQES